MNDNSFLQLAEYIATNLMKGGTPFDKAIENVTESMTLTLKESEEVRERIKKSKPEIQPVKEETLEEETPTIAGNSIQFATEDMDTAVGVLMYKGIPWTGKTENTVTFESADHVSQAKEALNRRWDFTNAQPRKVAVVEFDNIEDYQKVLEFMASKKMAGTMMESDSLEEDIDLENMLSEQSHKRALKDAKEIGADAPVRQSQAMSYAAQRKDASVNLGALDPIKEQNARSIRISKRWK